MTDVEQLFLEVREEHKLSDLNALLMVFLIMLDEQMETLH